MLRTIFLIFGGLVGLLSLLVGYILHLDPESPARMEDLNGDLQDWFKKGRMLEVLDRQMFAIVEGEGPETVILIHGFPTSSYDYHHVLPFLVNQGCRVVMFDHLGFGFSDKPVDYTYSLIDQAEQAIQLWTQLDIKNAHVVSHDMGDSVLTEILSRVDRGVIPDRFKNFFKSVTFTNGGMRYEMINFRLIQSLMMSSLGPLLSEILTRIPRDKVQNSQIASIWGNYRENMDVDIKDINMLNNYKGGSEIIHKTISYLHDRARFEARWLTSLTRLKSQIPFMLMWGDNDAVSPMTIPRSVAEFVNPKKFVTIKGAGHFLTLEQPEVWSSNILDFIKSI